MTRELLIGCGRDRRKRIETPNGWEWKKLTAIDFNIEVGPDAVVDLEQVHLPFPENTFDEIHAYEVLEHTGNQGDWRFFFDQFTEFWRVLRPSGLFVATVPMWDSMWAWGDPSHKRVISEGSLVFLDQSEYEKQCGKTPMSDFRFYYKADFEKVGELSASGQYIFILRARK